MNGFFRGWKRKLGLACMVLVCLVTIEWMRSSIATRAYSFNFGRQYRDVFVSRESFLFWIVPGEVRFPRWEFAVDVTDVVMKVDDNGIEVMRPQLKGELWLTYMTQQTGSKIQLNKFPLRVIAVPFWMITTPLIILASLLVLSRQPSQKSGTEAETQAKSRRLK